MKIRNPYRCRGASACLLACCVLLTLTACGGGDDEAAEARPAAEADARAGAATGELPLPTPADTAAAPVPDAAARVEPAAEPAREPAPQPVAEPEPAPTPPPPPAVAPVGEFALQLGSFRQSQRASALAERVREAGHAATIEMAEVGGTAWHRVMLDGFADRAEAGRVGEELRTRLGIDYLIRRRD